MIRFLLLISIIPFSSLVYSQLHYSPQVKYDSPGGLFDVDSIRTIDINFYDDNFIEILHSGWENQSGLRLPASISLSNGISFDSVAIRYKGNATYSIAADAGNPKRPFNIDINDIVNDQLLMGYNKLKLANCILDPSYTKEVLAYDIYQEYLPSPEANYMNVNVQNEPHGLYVNTESINKQFLSKHFGESEGVLFKCDPLVQFGQQGEGVSDLAYLGSDTSDYIIHYTLKSDHGWAELVNMIDILNNDPENLHTVLNIDRVLWAFAVNMAVANLDSYNGMVRHNYYFYQTNDGLFQMIPWDVSESFVGVFLGFGDPDFLYEYDPFFGFFAWWQPLVLQLVTDKESLNSRIFAAHMRTILEERMDEDEIEEYLDQTWERMYDYAVADNLRPFSLEWAQQNLYEVVSDQNFTSAGILSTVTKRNDFLLTHDDINFITPEFQNLEYRTVDGLQIIDAQVSDVDQVEIMATTNPKASFFESFPMYDDGTNGDLVAEDGVFSAVIPFQNELKEIKYYLRARNQNAVKLSPERAEYEYYYLQAAPRVGEVVINEFMASNDSIVADQDGEYDDWIELYNNTMEDIDLTGHGLADEIGGDYWRFPDTFIAANDYLIIWADDDLDQSGLHADFKLSAGGEAVVLVDGSDLILDDIEFSAQETDISFGRFINGVGDFISMPPTFSAENSMFTSIVNAHRNAHNITVSPNPALFSSRIIIETFSNSSDIHMHLYDQRGSLIQELRPASNSGTETVFAWDLNSADGQRVAPGIYHGFIQEGSESSVVKIVVL